MSTTSRATTMITSRSGQPAVALSCAWTSVLSMQRSASRQVWLSHILWQDTLVRSLSLMYKSTLPEALKQLCAAGGCCCGVCPRPISAGGRKVISPGIAHAETITTFHSARFMEDPKAVEGETKTPGDAAKSNILIRARVSVSFCACRRKS